MNDTTSVRNNISGTVVGAVIQANGVTVAGLPDARRAVWMVPEPTSTLVDRVELADRLLVLLYDGVTGIWRAG
jgi:hypothetical protein